MRVIPIGLTLLALLAAGCNNSDSRPTAPKPPPADPAAEAKAEEMLKKQPAKVGSLTD